MLRAALAPAIAGHWSIVTDESPHGLAIGCQVLFFGDGNTKREKAYTKVSSTPVHPLGRLRVTHIKCGHVRRKSIDVR
jgi:hypothetical protein